jgi:hypothetical protein
VDLVVDLADREAQAADVVVAVDSVQVAMAFSRLPRLK